MSGEADMPHGGTITDADGTLVRPHMYYPWVQELCATRPLALAALERIEEARNAHIHRVGSFEEFSDQFVAFLYHEARYLKDVTQDEASRVGRRVFEKTGKRVHVFPRELITASKDVGMHRAIISGSPVEVITPLAEWLHIEHVYGTEMEVQNGVYTGCLQMAWVEHKGQAVQELASEHAYDLARSVALGDTPSDVPMLERVGYPICFNPNQRLLDIACKRGWPVYIEKKDLRLAFRHDTNGTLRGTDLMNILPHPLGMVMQDRLSRVYAS